MTCFCCRPAGRCYEGERLHCAHLHTQLPDSAGARTGRRLLWTARHPHARARRRHAQGRCAYTAAGHCKLPAGLGGLVHCGYARLPENNTGGQAHYVCDLCCRPCGAAGLGFSLTELLFLPAGPSAGCAIITAITSLALDRPVRPDLAMTGAASLFRHSQKLGLPCPHTYLPACCLRTVRGNAASLWLPLCR